MTNELIMEYSNFIYGIAKNFTNYKNKEDLFQVGCLGLVMAYRKYKPEENTKFTTYAYPYILGEMCKLIREDKGIKISRNITRLKNNIEKANNYLSQKLLRQPTNKEISDFLEIPEEEINQALRTINILQSIDEPISEDGKSINLYDVTPDRKLDMDTLIALREELNNLDEESKKILMYSIDTDLSQAEIGNMFNMNQVQVSRTLTKIKNNIRSKVA